MNGPGITLSLGLGKALTSPAPKFIAEALQTVVVTQSDTSPTGFQLVFHADRTKQLSQDYALLSSPLLAPSNRVTVTVTLNGTPHTLMDGFITNQELSHSQEFGPATLTVTGEDVSVLMDLYEYPLEYPAMGDAAIVALVLGKYSMIGIIPEIIPTPSDLVSLPVDRVPQQNSTDRAYLKYLACPYGYLFHVKPGPVAATNIAYWGPPSRIGSPQPALTVGMGPATNVESINFNYNALDPYLVHGMVQDDTADSDLPVATLNSTRIPLSSRPALLANKPFIRNLQFTDPRFGIVEALVEAQSMTNVSADQVVTVQGQLDTIRYGNILNAPGLVGMRGVGNSYDGTYYVKSVTHRLSRGSYKQKFTLTRSGTGSLVTHVTP